jgi:hypothetical protein
MRSLSNSTFGTSAGPAASARSIRSVAAEESGNGGVRRGIAAQPTTRSTAARSKWTRNGCRKRRGAIAPRRYDIVAPCGRLDEHLDGYRCASGMTVKNG